jgi:hypothetical protein
MPDNALVRYHLGMSYLATGEPRKASDEFNVALGKTADGELEAKIKAGLKEASAR